MKGIILAAGKGTRLKELTLQGPKVMVEINGKPCLQYNIEFLRKNGITDIGINTHHFPEIIRNYFGDGSKFGVNLRYSFEQELLGTSGSLNKFREFLTESFVLVYGDVIHQANLSEMIQFHKMKNGFATVALDHREYKSSAVILEGDQIVDFIEKPKKDLENAYVNSGIYILEPEIYDLIPEGFSDFGFDIFPEALKQKRKLLGFRLEKKVIDIGTIQGLNEARAGLRNE